MNFIVYAPGDYSPYGGGSIALHKLAHNLAVLGQASYIVTSKKNPAYQGVQVDEEQARQLAQAGIVIYPEVTIGNPLNAPRVMRWILYNVRTYDSFGLFGRTDLIYRYAPMYTLRFPQPVQGELRAMELNLDIFANRGYERQGSCYMLRKQGHKLLIHAPDSTDINSYATMGGNNYLADMFNRCLIFYSYDDANWCCIQAALCGCLPVVVPTEGISAAEWHEKFPYFKYGIAYGMDDIPYAQATQKLLKKHLLELEQETLVQTKAFIDTAYRLA